MKGPSFLGNVPKFVFLQSKVPTSVLFPSSTRRFLSTYSRNHWAPNSSQSLLLTSHKQNSFSNRVVSNWGFVRCLSDSLKQRLDETVRNNDVVLFMKGTPDAPQCGFSRAVVQILDAQGVDAKQIKAYNVLEDQDLRNGIKEYSSWPTIPQVYLKGVFVGGCDILLQMHQSGELETLLKEKELVPGDL